MELNYDEWKRKDIYEFFSSMSNPFYMVTFREDVTNLYRYTKAHGLSFYAGMIWACTQAFNQTEAFLMAVKNGRLIRYDRRDPSFTDLNPGEEQFHIVTMDHMDVIDDFCREAIKQSRAQTEFIDSSRETDALIYYSCLPWIELTALTNERNLSDEESLNDSIPRIAWGKYTEENGRKVLHVSLEVNHRFIDGIHIGKFSEALERVMRELNP